MADEVELKLDLTPEAADAIEASGLLDGEPKRVQQKSVHFDTPDRDLAKKGLSLRIRQSNGRRVQTIKADGASAVGLFARSEWERVVGDDAPVLDDATPLGALPSDAADALGPAFEVQIERRIWMIHERGTAIELALDRGAVVAGERQAPICELELELKRGDPARLFALARRIDAVAPVRLGVRSKAERGYCLIGPAATMVKAEPIGLGGDATAAQAFRRIVQSCMRQFRLNEALWATCRHPEALHQARVALRRLRSALTIFKPMLGEVDVDLREGLRWLALALGDARDLDVLLERVPHGPLRDRLMGARDAAYDRAGDALSSARARRLMLDLAEWIAGDAWMGSAGSEVDAAQPARAFAVVALDRFRHKVKKGGSDLAAASDPARHQVRKDAKKLRYAAEFFASLFGGKHAVRRYTRFIAALESLQGRLGALNDLVTAPVLLEKLGLASDPDAAKLLARRKRRTLLDHAVHAYEQLFDTKRFWG